MRIICIVSADRDRAFPACGIDNAACDRNILDVSILSGSDAGTAGVAGSFHLPAGDCDAALAGDFCVAVIIKPVHPAADPDTGGLVWFPRNASPVSFNIRFYSRVILADRDLTITVSGVIVSAFYVVMSKSAADSAGASAGRHGSARDFDSDGVSIFPASNSRGAEGTYCLNRPPVDLNVLNTAPCASTDSCAAIMIIIVFIIDRMHRSSVDCDVIAVRLCVGNQNISRRSADCSRGTAARDRCDFSVIEGDAVDLSTEVRADPRTAAKAAVF